MPGISINTLDPNTGLNTKQEGLDFKISKSSGISFNSIAKDEQHQVNIPSNLVPINDTFQNYEKTIGNDIWLTDTGADQLDDMRAANTPWYKNFANGAASRLISVIPKIGQTVGAVAGLTKYTADLLGVTGDEHNFETVYNNQIMKTMSEMDDNLKEQFPVYASHYYNSDDFFKKISTQKFWFEDGFDGLAFLGSAAATGGATIGGLTKLGVSRGMAMGLGTLGNTIGESAMEAKDTHDTISQQLSQMIDENGQPLYTEEEVKQKAAKGALNTFGANMLLLGPSNMWETKILFGGASNPFLKTARKIFNGELQSAEVQSLKYGMAEGIIKEGLWEEGLQTAVQQWEQRRAKGEVNSSGLLGGYIEQWFKDWSNIDGQTSMLLGAVIGLGGGAYGAHKGNKQNKAQFAEAQQFVNDWKQQLQIGENTFVDNNKRLYIRDAQGNLVMTRGEDQIRHNNTIPTYDPVFDTDNILKRSLQLQYDNEATQTAINAAINNDEIAQSMTTHDIYARKVYSYLSNPLFESSDQALETFIKDTQTNIDKLAQNETDPNERAILYKGYNDAMAIATQIKQKWDDSTKKIGGSEDLLGTDLQKQFNNKIKKAVLVNEVKKMALEKVRANYLTNEKVSSEIDGLIKEANDTINKFSNKRERTQMFKEYERDSLDSQTLSSKIEELEAKKTKDGSLSDVEQDNLDELKYKANLSNYIEGESYLNRIGDNSAKGLLISDNSQINTNIDRIGAKNNHYMTKGIDERDYSNGIDYISDLLTSDEKDDISEASRTFSRLVRMVEDPNNSNISKKRYNQLLDLHKQIKDKLNEKLNENQSAVNQITDMLFDIDPITGESISNLSDEEQIDATNALMHLQSTKSDIESDIDSLDKSSINTESEDKLVDKNKIFTEFENAKEQGKLNEFLEKEFIKRNYINSPVQFIKDFERNPDNFDNIEELNNFLEDLKYIQKIIKDKYPELNDEINSIYNKLNDDVKPVILKNSQQRQLVQKRNEANNKKVSWYQFGVYLDSAQDEFTLEIKNTQNDTDILNELKSILGEDYINSILKEASKNNFDLAYVYQIIDQLKNKSEKDLKSLKKLLEKNKEAYFETILNLELNYSNRPPFKLKGYISKTAELYKKNPKLLLKDLLTDPAVQGSRIRNTLNNPNQFNEKDELWYYSPLYKFGQNNSSLSLLNNVKAKGYTGTTLEKDSLINLLQLHLRFSALFDLEDSLNNNFNYGEFLSKLKKVSNDFGIAPTYEQEMAIRDIVFWYNTDREFAYMKGIAGAGKTNIVTKYATKILELESEDMLAIAHNDIAATNIKNSINPNQKTTTLEDLYNDYKTLITDKTKLIVLDEVNANESNYLWNKKVVSLRFIIDEINKERKKTNIPEIKVFLLGDPTQITKERSLYNTSTSVLEKLESENVSSITPLTLAYRSDVGSINEISKKFQDNPREVLSLKLNTNSPLGTKDIKGVYASSLRRTSNGIPEDFMKQLTVDSGRSKIVIVLDESEKSKYNSLNVPNLIVLTFQEAQGTTFQEAYIDINKDDYLREYNKNKEESELEFNTGMYTSLSRASEFVMFADNSSSFINQVDDKTSVVNDELKKEKEDNKKDLNERIDKSLDILGIDSKYVVEQSVTKEQKNEDEKSEIKDEDLVDTDTLEDENEIESPIEEIPAQNDQTVSDINNDEIVFIDALNLGKEDNNLVVEIKAPQFNTITSKLDPIRNQSRLITTPSGEQKIIPLVQEGSQVKYVLSRRSINDASVVIKIVAKRTEVENNVPVINSGKFYEVIGIINLESLDPTIPFENALLEKASKAKNIDVLFEKNKSEEISTIDNNTNVLFEGSIKAIQEQNFIYDKKNIPQKELNKNGGLKEYITKKAYKLLADKHTLDLDEQTFYNSAKVSNFRVKIFKSNDKFRRITPTGFDSQRFAGYPYAIFDISFKDKNGTVRTDSKFIRLDPRQLNTEDKIYKNIKRYSDAINKIEEAFTNEKIFTKEGYPFGLSNKTFNKILAEFRKDFIPQEDGKDYKGVKKYSVVERQAKVVTKENIEKILKEDDVTLKQDISNELFKTLQDASKDIIPLTYKAKKANQKTSLNGYLSYLESQIGETITKEDFDNIKSYYDKLYETGIINTDNTNFGAASKLDDFSIDFSKTVQMSKEELRVLYNMSKTFFIGNNTVENALMGTSNVLKQLASQGILNSEASFGSIVKKTRVFRSAVSSMSFIPIYKKDKNSQLIKDETKHYGWDPLTGQVNVYPNLPETRYVSSDSKPLEIVKLTSGEGEINKSLNNLVQANTVNPKNSLRLTKYLSTGRAYVAPTVLSYSDDINYSYLKFLRTSFNEFIDNQKAKGLQHQFDDLKDESGIKYQTLDRYTKSGPGKLRKDLKLEDDSIREKVVQFLLDNKIVTPAQIQEEIEDTPKRKITSEDLNQITQSIEQSKLRFPLNRFKLDDLSDKARLSESSDENDKIEGKEALRELESLLVTNLKDIQPTRVQVKINNFEGPKQEPKQEKNKTSKKIEPKTILENERFSLELMEDGKYAIFDNNPISPEEKDIHYEDYESALTKFNELSKDIINKTEVKIETTPTIDFSGLEGFTDINFSEGLPDESLNITGWVQDEQKFREDIKGEDLEDKC